MKEKIWVAIIGLIAWFALLLQLFILVNNTPGNGMTPLQAIGRFFHFFTILTNLIVAISLTVIFFKSSTAGTNFLAKPVVLTGIAVYIFIVGLLYNLVLRNLWHPTGLQKIADELLHVFVPLLFVAYWLLFIDKSSLKWSQVFAWLIYPAIYFIYAMIRGYSEGFYPYPFLDANKLSATQITVNCTGLLIVFVVTGLAFIWVGKISYRRNKKTT